MLKLILILLVVKIVLSAIFVYYFPHILLWIIQKILIKMDKLENHFLVSSKKKYPKSRFKKLFNFNK